MAKTKSEKTVPSKPVIMQDATGKKVRLNWNHEHPVCPECRGRSAGTTMYCGTCKGHGTVCPETGKALTPPAWAKKPDTETELAAELPDNPADVGQPANA